MNAAKVLIAGLVALLAGGAQASTVNSNQADCFAGTGRIFTVVATTVNRCLLAGSGNINGGNGGAADTAFVNSGWTFIDASDTNGGAHDGWLTGAPSLVEGLAGSFTINAAAYTTYDKIAIGFKSGDGQIDPVWAIFELADNTLSGTWSISGRQQLSHALLYGFGTPDDEELPPTGGSVPEPASLVLVGLGLLAAGAARRRRS